MCDFASGCRASSTGCRCTPSAPATACTSSGTRSARRRHLLVQLPSPSGRGTRHAAVCGDTVIWKRPRTRRSPPSRAAHLQPRDGEVRGRRVFNLVVAPAASRAAAGRRRPRAARLFTGSTQQGRNVSRSLAGRFAVRSWSSAATNAVIVMPDANSTWRCAPVCSRPSHRGQRCTSLRR